jgi:hypothetical protein
LTARLAAFAATDTVSRLTTRAGASFWNVDGSETSVHGRDAGSDACFVEWLLLDYVAPNRTGPLLGEFADTAAGLDGREERLLFALLLAPMRAYEVMETPGPGGVPLKDLLTGSEAVLGSIGTPDSLIRSDVCIARLLPFGRVRRPGLSLLRLPPGSQAELSAFLRAAYRVARSERHVSLEDYVDGSPHLYHHFFRER